MKRQLLAGTVVVVAVVVAGVLAFPGVVSVPDINASSDGSAEAAGTDAVGATATPESSRSVSDGGSNADAPFGFTVDRIEKCGRTCRDVTTTLTNRQSTDAANVTVVTRMYAGNGTGGDPVWTGERAVGDLPAGGSTTATTRVDLGLSDALAIERNDGWITIETTVRSDSETMTITQRRDVT